MGISIHQIMPPNCFIEASFHCPLLAITYALYYRSLKPGVMDDFRVSGASNPASSVITQVCKQISSIITTSIIILLF